MKDKAMVNREFADAVRALDVKRMDDLLNQGAEMHEGFDGGEGVECVWNAFIIGADNALTKPLEWYTREEARNWLVRLQDVGRFLLSRGANINFQPADGFSGLFDAVHDSVDITALFLSLGADPNVVCRLDWGDETVLSHVLDDDRYKEHDDDIPYFEIEELLQSFGAKRTNDVGTVKGLYHKRTRVCKRQIAQIDSKRVGYIGIQCGLTEDQKRLYRLCKCRGKSDQIRDLLNNGVDPNFQFTRMAPLAAYVPIEEWMPYWDSPIHFAAANHGVETVRLMIERGADPKVKDFWESEPLLYAADAHNLEMIKFLVEECGNDPGWQNGDGIIPYWRVRDLPEINWWMVAKAKEYDPEHEEWYEEDAYDDE